MRHKLWLCTVLSLLLCLTIMPITAQNPDTTSFFDEHPLLQMLSTVSDEQAMREDIIYYMDYRAVENAVDYIPTYDTVDEWISGDEWMGFTDRWLSLPVTLNGLEFWEELERIPEVLGFDFFDLDQTLEAGRTPSTVTVWRGDFDEDAIIEAHLGRDYEARTTNDISVLCATSPDFDTNCNYVAPPDFENRDLANLFDPVLARNPFVGILPNMLISAFSPLYFGNAISARADEIPSLADNPEIRALSEAILNPDVYSGDLVQAEFLPRFHVLYDMVNRLPNLPDNDRFIFDDYGDLPHVELSIIADRQEGDTQVALIGLLYDNEADAQLAVDEVTARITTFSDYLLNNTTVPVIDNIEGTMVNEGYVYASESTGLYVAVISANYPTPTGRFDSALEGSPPPLAQLFEIWISGVWFGGFYPLWELDFQPE